MLLSQRIEERVRVALPNVCNPSFYERLAWETARIALALLAEDEEKARL
jgi:hypothetical protein